MKSQIQKKKKRIVELLTPTFLGKNNMGRLF